MPDVVEHVAKIRLPDGGEAFLDDGGNWSSPGDVYLAIYLNTVYSTVHYPPSPSAPRAMVGRQAVAAAEKLPAELEWLVPEDPREVVY